MKHSFSVVRGAVVSCCGAVPGTWQVPRIEGMVYRVRGVRRSIGAEHPRSGGCLLRQGAERCSGDKGLGSALVMGVGEPF